MAYRMHFGPPPASAPRAQQPNRANCSRWWFSLQRSFLPQLAALLANRLVFQAYRGGCGTELDEASHPTDQPAVNYSILNCVREPVFDAIDYATTSLLKLTASVVLICEP